MQDPQIVAQQIDGNKPMSASYIYCFMANHSLQTPPPPFSLPTSNFSSPTLKIEETNCEENGKMLCTNLGAVKSCELLA